MRARDSIRELSVIKCTEDNLTAQDNGQDTISDSSFPSGISELMHHILESRHPSRPRMTLFPAHADSFEMN